MIFFTSRTELIDGPHSKLVVATLREIMMMNKIREDISSGVVSIFQRQHNQLPCSSY